MTYAPAVISLGEKLDSFSDHWNPHIVMMDREGEPNTGADPSSHTREKLETL